MTRGAFNGAFSADEDTSDGGSDHSEYAVSGKLTRTAGSGRIKVDLTSKDSAGTVVDTCSTGSVTFKVAS